MSSISSAVQLLTSLSLLPSNASGAAQKATPAQLTSMAVSNAGLQEADTLFASPSTASSDDYYTSAAGSGITNASITNADTADSVSLSNALLQSLTPATATAASPSTSSNASTAFSLLA